MVRSATITTALLALRVVLALPELGSAHQALAARAEARESYLQPVGFDLCVGLPLAHAAPFLLSESARHHGGADEHAHPHGGAAALLHPVHGRTLPTSAPPGDSE